MSEVLRFEVRPLEGGFAAVGEEVAFKEEGGRLYALNEDGEAFGVVPKAVAARLEVAGTDSLSAEVASRADGVLTISVMGLDSGEASTEVAAEPEQTATSSQTVPTTSSTGSQFAKASQPADDVQIVEDVPSIEDSSHVSTVEQDQGGKKPKGKYIVIAVVVVLFAICAVMLFAGSASDDTQTVSDGTISLEVPADWEVEEDDGTYAINSTDYGAAVSFFSITDYLDGSLTADEVWELVSVGSIVSVDEADGEETVTSEGAIIRTNDFEYLSDGVEYEGEVEIILSGTSFSCVSAIGTDEYEDDIEDVLDSVTVLDPSEPDLLD